MPQSLASAPLHLVFSTKDREPWLQHPELRTRMHDYLGGICRELGCTAILIGGIADHVHILAMLSRTMTISDLVRDLKRPSSLWIKEQDPRLVGFAWQNGYGAFAVSQSKIAAVTAYIGNQEEHHRTCSFQDEYRELLRKHNLEWD
jgi:REP element-mobilizing transposase RayT